MVGSVNRHDFVLGYHDVQKNDLAGLIADAGEIGPDGMSFAGKHVAGSAVLLEDRVAVFRFGFEKFKLLPIRWIVFCHIG